MDGMSQRFVPGLDQPASLTQRTLLNPICCMGVGLHTGRPVRVTLRQAPANAGISFHRTDLNITIPARYDHVTDTRLCTVLSTGPARVGTVEHVMAALAGCGITSAIIDVDGPELPVLDGSAGPWVFLIDCAGIVDLGQSVASITVQRTIRVTDGDAWAELRPNPAEGLDMALSIDFPAAAIGRPALTLRLNPAVCRAQLADCRTFVLAHEIAGLKAAGLAAGGSLHNAVVVDGARVLNPAGLRVSDEFVRHKMLDAVGDLALAGVSLNARFAGHKSGHALNNRLLRALFADVAMPAVVATPRLTVTA